MLSRLGQLWSGSKEKASVQKPGAGVPSALPPIVPATVATVKNSPSVMRREAMLGRDRRVAGYTFMLRRDKEDSSPAPLPDLRRLHDDTLLNNLRHMDITRLLGQRIAFIPITPPTLESPLMEGWPAKGSVWIMQLEADASIEAALLARLETLKERGCRVAMEISDILPQARHSLLPFVDYVLMDVSNLDITVITAHMATVSRIASGKQFVATEVQTLETFHMCHKLQFALFMGPFITRRETLDNPVIGPSRAKLLDLMNRVRTGAEQDELASQFRHDPALSVRLLRYVNSPGMGLQNRIGGIEQALMIMGNDKLYRWLTMILFTGGQTHELDHAVRENALTRGRLAEQLAGRALFAKARDEIFVAGLFSLLDVVMAMPMEQILKQIGLPAEITEAILSQRGPYAPYLALAIACEHDDQQSIAALAREIGRDTDEINAAHMEALLWVQELSEV